MENYNMKEYERDIKLYINDLMDNSQKKAFENKIEKNEDLRNEVNAQMFEKSFYLMSLRAKFRGMYLESEIAKQTPKRTGVLVFLSQYTIAIAASVLIALTGIGVWFGVKQHQDEQDSLARAQAQRDSVQRVLEQQRYRITTRELINSNIADSKQPLVGVPNGLKNLVLQYEQAEDSIAYKRLARQLVPRSANPPAQNSDPDEYGGVNTETNPSRTEENTTIASYRALYHGLSLLALEKYDAALRRFDHVRVQQLADEVQWYKTLTYLKKGDKRKGKESLETIVKSNSKFRTQAQALMDAIQ